MSRELVYHREGVDYIAYIHKRTRLFGLVRPTYTARMTYYGNPDSIEPTKWISGRVNDIEHGQRCLDGWLEWWRKDSAQ